MSAKFSLPYTVAYALRYGQLTEAAFDWRQPPSPDVLSLAGRVTWEIDPHFDVGMAENGYVSVTATADGTVTAEQPNCRGSWRNPLGTAEVEVKFADNVAGRLGPARTAALAGLVEDIESVSDLTGLFDLCIIDAQNAVFVS
jgi:2-methylcitrate dehydratase PrpD